MVLHHGQVWSGHDSAHPGRGQRAQRDADDPLVRTGQTYSEAAISCRKRYAFSMADMRTTALAVAIYCIAAHAQDFTAASVKPAEPLLPGADVTMRGGPGTDDPGRITYPHVSLFMLLMRAYNVAEDQISCKDWHLATQWYYVTATMPPKTSPAQFRVMLQRLLAKRFHLTLHREKKKAPGYDLVVASGGLKIKPSPPEGAKLEVSGFPTLLPEASSASTLISPTSSTLTVRSTNRMTLAQLADGLGRKLMINTGAYGPLGDTPGDMELAPRVVDKTGLTGKYDFTLEYGLPTGVVGVKDPVPGGPTLFAALENQLGLKLVESKAVPLVVLVVDHWDKVPTEN
jgi:uncharacterized protein (TIGR03435 family)